ncbi:hypothetical protein B0H15DRAFT_972724 [Mycena belliarum]|uniref:Protein kinase domain-containing protein n=1 Tax=Mycena belliarum TaxID=1033014 RepID=A0AAD6XR10_9AGAR|nr:hypothetical protein B0H15DRAFT_972724 [Mycena belliae]
MDIPYVEESWSFIPAKSLADLTSAERFWQAHQPWLKERGYMLRPRFRPGWVPSWQGTDKEPLECEDGLRLEMANLMDARRIRDNMDVCLKRIDVEIFPHEQDIGTYLSSEPLASDPRNHCVPILETLQVPNRSELRILVMPLLRRYEQPRFDTFGETIDFFDQIFEGVKFMHDHNITHRDCIGNNIMMDGSKTFPDGFHPVRYKKKQDLSGTAKFYTRTQRPPKYYLIDFGLSRRYETRDPPPLEPPIEGGDPNAPEFRFRANGRLPPESCDPFPTDIYYLGRLILGGFIEGYSGIGRDNHKHGFEFMKALADDMVGEDPAKRPTIDEVIERFAAIRDSLSSWKLRSRVVRSRDFPNPSRPMKHWLRRVWFIIRRTPSVPSYRKRC